MPIISVLARPERRDLDPTVVAGLARGWGGGPVRELGSRLAYEFDVEQVPADVEPVRDRFQADGFDLVWQPATGARRKRLLIADMDSTMINEESLDELAAAAGVGARVAEITARAMNGELRFDEAVDARLAMLRGVPLALVDDVLATSITDAPGGATLVATMRAAGAHTALVSGGFSVFTGPVAARLGFDEFRCNTLEIDGDVLAGRAVRPILGKTAKVEALTTIAERRGIPLADSLAIGDGANDLDMIHAAGLGVALHAKPSVQAAARVRLNHADLTGCLYLQGFREAEFADVE